MSQSHHIPGDFKATADCLKDRVIIVTGGANGIGAAASRTYAAHGATVVLMDKNVKLLESLYDELEDAQDDGVPLKEKIMFTSQMSVMIKSGLPVLDALKIVLKQTQNPKMTEVLTSIIQDVSSGLSFSMALSKHPVVPRI